MNSTTKTNLDTDKNISLLWENINSSDESMLKQLNNIFINVETVKSNLITYILNSNSSIPINNSNDIIKLFNLVSTFNTRYQMASNNWNYKIEDSKLFIQNSISKKDSNTSFYQNYINLIKKKLVESNIDFNYFEFKVKRFNKTKDIIFVFDLQQFDKLNKK